MRLNLRYVLPMVLAVSPTALFAQWLGYPTPGVPRTPDGQPNLAAPAPRTADGKPDFSGMWGWVNTGKPCGAQCTDTQISREFINIAATLKDPLPYRPWAAEIVKKRRVEQGLDPNVHCMPRDAPRIWTDDFYKRIFQVQDRVILLMERNMQYRQIFTDGRKIPNDPNPTWNGYSTGHWEGDTLVVETTGFRDDLWLDASGNPLTDQAKMTERIRRPTYGTLEIEITINDMKAYTAPWTVKLTEPLVLDSELIDYYCLENEKDAPHMREQAPIGTPR
ncbi:MAG TPA: hypothetical protein VN841_28410 [Bryobacteraceae bacterium]|nr:hypothetical protein [Bryobacteraceae bacterium]